MSTSTAQRWRVVETRYSETGQTVRVIHHTHIGGQPMDSLAARGLATQETGRYAGARLRRSFRAEPVAETAPGPDQDRCPCGHSLTHDHSGLARTCWHTMPDNLWCQCVGGQPVLTSGGTPS